MLVNCGEDENVEWRSRRDVVERDHVVILIRDGRRQLAALDAEDRPLSVRVWAGAHCLEFEPVRTEQALQALAVQRGAAALDARMAQREWRRGTLRFP